MLRVVQVETVEQLWQYQALSAELRAWDGEIAAGMGLDLNDSVPESEQPSGDDIPEEFAAPNGRMFLAMFEGQPAGCAGLRFHAPEIGEIKHLFVQPTFRGKGIGRGLMEALISGAREIGYTTLYLNTTSYMQEAQALYRAYGFKDMPPYRDVPEGFRAIELFMMMEL